MKYLTASPLASNGPVFKVLSEKGEEIKPKTIPRPKSKKIIKKNQALCEAFLNISSY